MAAVSSPATTATMATIVSNLHSFDLVACARRSIEKVVDEKGLKILLMDETTQDVVSMCYSFSDLLQKDLYLLDKVSSTDRQKQGHLKAMVYVRPTEENVQHICRELRNPLYAEYHLFFTNIVPEDLLDDLALADEHEAVKQVHEVYTDFFPMHPWTFSVDLHKPLIKDRELQYCSPRIVDSLVGVLLSIRRRPAIRYQGSSTVAATLAKDLSKRMNIEAALFDRKSDECLLIILDRADDLATPLLTQWSYEAMVHEEFSILKHKTAIAATQSDGSTKQEEMNLVPLFDKFWSDNLHVTWGDLCSNVKAVVDSYQEKTSNRASSNNLEDLRKIMDKIPELKKESITMSKHATLAAELGRIIRNRKLLELSLLEQDLVCSNGHREHADRVEEMLESGEITETKDLVRLVMLYMLRWERSKDNQIGRFKNLLKSRGITSDEEEALDQVLEYGGAAKRASDLFDDKKFTSILRQAVKGLQDVENVYTQHEPLLKRTLRDILKSKLPLETFPYLANPRTPKRA
eukprot:gene11307-17371_t